MATAKRLPSGSYRVRVYDKNTGKYKSFTAETKKAAELAAAEWLIKCQDEENQQITFQTAAEEYIKIKNACAITHHDTRLSDYPAQQC